MAHREALKEPLLANGAADEEAPLLEGMKVPPPAASSSADDEDEDEEGVEDGLALRLKHLWSSPAMATACCIFLCFILKVVQQVRLACAPSRVAGRSLMPTSHREWRTTCCCV